MYVVSVKTSKLKVFVAVIILVVFLLLGIFYIAGNKSDSENNKQYKAINLRAETAQERVAFLSQFGWVVEEEPIDIKETVIPETFDEVYEQYNELQQQQGFDLAPYCGKRVKRWTYRVLNYPGFENNNDHIRANLLVSDGAVIGGDICNIALDGFMQPFNTLEKGMSGIDQKVTEPINQ